MTVQELSFLHNVFTDKLIGFCSGVFDLTHPGHFYFFEQCKKQCGVLFVMVGGDDCVKKRKGDSRPIINQVGRLYMVKNCKFVDYGFSNLIPEQMSHIWDNIELVFKYLKPSIYFINEDAFDIEPRIQICDNHKVKLKMMSRDWPSDIGEISTTKIIDKITHDSHKNTAPLFV